jgi:hypothetical protein
MEATSSEHLRAADLKRLQLGITQVKLQPQDSASQGRPFHLVEQLAGRGVPQADVMPTCPRIR